MKAPNSSTESYWTRLTEDAENVKSVTFYSCKRSRCCSHRHYCPRALPHLHDHAGTCLPCSSYQTYTACTNPECPSPKCVKDTRRVPVAFFARKVLGPHARPPKDKDRALASIVSYASMLEAQYRVQGLLPLELPYDELVQRLLSLRGSGVVRNRAKARRKLSNHKIV